ncbi:hypothetical protein ACLMJK_002433 [Lecanora helva]
MQSKSILSLLLLGTSAIAHPGQSPVQKRTLTPDNTCGNTGAGANHGYTCDPSVSNGGPCCSSNGYCGTTSAYCGTGCQSAFGTCGHNVSPAPPKSGCTWNVANAGSFTQHKTFDFTNNQFPAGLAISTDTIGAGTAPYSQLYKTQNVAVSGGALRLTVPGGQHASPITGAEVYTTDKDILYGSVRTTFQVSNVAGTCHGSFFYKTDNQETDIEILTKDLATGAHYTNQNVAGNGPSTTITGALPSDATTNYHEYRLDWIPGKTLFYLDGVLQKTLTANVPSVAGEWIWNNWSNGDSGWTSGPPTADNVMKIQRIDMYYNRTGNAGTC